MAGSLALLALALVPVGAAAPHRAAAVPVLLYLSPSGSDAGRCTRAAPCVGFARAYHLARPGATVLVGGGRYGDQTIGARAGRIGPKVIFRPAAGARVVVRELIVSASHLELRDFAAREIEVPRAANDVTFRNIRDRGIWMQGPSNISVIGGEVACGMCAYHPHIDDGGPPDHRPPRHILFDGVYFHDWQAVSSAQHTECLQILAGDGITIRNSVFKDCGTANDGRGATANLFISWLGYGPKTRNVMVENNFFYRSGNTYAIQADDFANLAFRYNSIVGPIVIFGGHGDGTPVELVGNVMRFSGCRVQPDGGGPAAPLVYRYNVLAGGTCAPTDFNAPSGFIDPSSNLHLRAGAGAIDRGAPGLHPARDIDGQRRPPGEAPDAGADEVR